MLTCVKLLGIADISQMPCGFPNASESQLTTFIHKNIFKIVFLTI